MSVYPRYQKHWNITDCTFSIIHLLIFKVTNWFIFHLLVCKLYFLCVSNSSVTDYHCVKWRQALNSFLVVFHLFLSSGRKGSEDVQGLSQFSWWCLSSEVGLQISRDDLNKTSSLAERYVSCPTSRCWKNARDFH